MRKGAADDADDDAGALPTKAGAKPLGSALSAFASAATSFTSTVESTTSTLPPATGTNVGSRTALCGQARECCARVPRMVMFFRRITPRGPLTSTELLTPSRSRTMGPLLGQGR